MLRPVSLALSALVCWNLAFAFSGQVGIWVPIGLAALMLDVLALGLAGPDRWKSMGLVRPARGAAAWAVGATVVQLAATYLLYRPALAAWPALHEEVRGLFGLLGQPTGARAALLLPFVILSEEVVYRGALQGALARTLRPWTAAGLAVAVYATAHLASGSWALVGLAAVCGAYWAALRVVSGGLFAPVVCHLIWDLAILVVWPLEISARP